MYTALSLTDTQVLFLKENLESKIGKIKSEIRHSQNSEFKEQLKTQKDDIQNMLDQISGENYIKAA